MHPMVGSRKLFRGFDARLAAVKDKQWYFFMRFGGGFITASLPGRGTALVTPASVLTVKHSPQHRRRGIAGASLQLAMWSRLYRSFISWNRKYALNGAGSGQWLL